MTSFLLLAILLAGDVSFAFAAPPSTPPSHKRLQERFARSSTSIIQAEPAPVPSLHGWNIDVVDLVESGSCLTTHISGSLVYTVFGATLDVIDISNPSDPTRIGYALLPGTCWDIDQKDNYLYCQLNEAQSVSIVDVTNPMEPIVAGSAPGAGYFLDVEGDRLYVHYGDGFRIYDITAPTTPVLLGAAPSGMGFEIIVRGSYLYTAVYNKGLRVYDISNPSTPTIVATVLTGSGAQGIDIEGNYAYLTNYRSPGLGFYAVDIAAPTSPVVVGYYNSSSEPVAYIDVDATPGRAHVVDNHGTMVSFDISDPTQPTPFASATLCSLFDPWTINVEGGIAAVSGGYHAMCIIDVTNLPVSVGSYEAFSAFNDVELAPPYLALGLNSNRMLLMDRYDMNEQFFAIAGRLQSDANEVTVYGNYAYVGTNDNWFGSGDGLTVLDISDPANIARKGFLSLPQVLDIVSSDSHVYWTNWSQFLSIDVTNPTAPTVVGELPIGPGRDLALSLPYVYVAGPDGLRIIDVSNPTQPAYVGTALPLAGEARAIAVSNELAYVVVVHGQTGGLRIVNISVPTYPTVVSTFGAAGPGGGVVGVLYPFAYFEADGFLRVLDVSNPSTPVQVGGIEVGALMGNIVIAPPNIFAIQQTIGTVSGPLLKFQTDYISDAPGRTTSRALLLHQNFPNPFNPSTTISFELQSRSHAVLEIFDVRGELVRTLIDETLPAGSHSIEWDGKYAGRITARSGIYFYRLTAAGQSQAKKMVILK